MAAVVPRDRPGDAGSQGLIQAAVRSVVVVPQTLRSPVTMSRVLVSLDGTPESAETVADTVRLCAAAGLDLVVLHVFDSATVPRFWDQAAHERRGWEDELLARWCAVPGVRLCLRSGTPGEHVVDVARAEGVDMIALGWSWHLAPGQARTVRRTVSEATVPVLLVPISPGRSRSILPPDRLTAVSSKHDRIA